MHEEEFKMTAETGFAASHVWSRPKENVKTCAPAAWLSTDRCLARLVENWEPLKGFFDEVSGGKER